MPNNVRINTFLLQYFKTVLITEDLDSLQLHSKIYYIFDELCHISETIVDELIPTIEHRLTVGGRRDPTVAHIPRLGVQ